MVKRCKQNKGGVMKLIFDQFERMLLITNDKSFYADRLRLRLAYLKLIKEIKTQFVL